MLPELDTEQRVDTDRRLVEEQDGRPVDERDPVTPYAAAKNLTFSPAVSAG